jgi:hypothetical protein
MSAQARIGSSSAHFTSIPLSPCSTRKCAALEGGGGPSPRGGTSPRGPPGPPGCGEGEGGAGAVGRGPGGDCGGCPKAAVARSAAATPKHKDDLFNTTLLSNRGCGPDFKMGDLTTTGCGSRSRACVVRSSPRRTGVKEPTASRARLYGTRNSSISRRMSAIFHDDRQRESTTLQVAGNPGITCGERDSAPYRCSVWWVRQEREIRFIRDVRMETISGAAHRARRISQISLASATRAGHGRFPDHSVGTSPPDNTVLGTTASDARAAFCGAYLCLIQSVWNQCARGSDRTASCASSMRRSCPQKVFRTRGS